MKVLKSQMFIFNQKQIILICTFLFLLILAIIGIKGHKIMAKQEIIPQAVIEFGKKSGYEEDIISFGKWKEYSVYTPDDDEIIDLNYKITKKQIYEFYQRDFYSACDYCTLLEDAKKNL